MMECSEQSAVGNFLTEAEHFGCLMLKVQYTVTRFVSISAKFGIFTVVGLKRTLVDAEIRTFKCTN
jgi:hypothetical protein